MLAAARREDRDDVRDPGVLDVGDVGLHPAARGAGAGGAPDALFEAGGQPRQVEVARAPTRSGGCGPPGRSRERHRTGNSPAVKRALERLELAALVSAPSPTWASTPWRSRSVPASWRRQRTRSANTSTCSSRGDAGERLRGDAAQQRQPVAAAAHRRRRRVPGGQRLGERGLGVGERLGVDGGVEVDADVAEHDALDARELGQRLLVERLAGLEVAELAQQLEQPPVGVAAAAADRLEQLGQRRVGLERERLRGAHLGHPGLHVLAGDAHEVRAVVDAQAVGVRARRAGRRPRACSSRSRIIASSPSASPTSTSSCSELLPRGVAVSSQQSATRAHAQLGERLVGLGGGVGVAQRLVGDQQVPGERRQLGRVAVEHAVGARARRRGGRRARGRSARSWPAIERRARRATSTLDVGGQRRQPAPGRAVRELVAPLAEQAALGDDQRAQPGRGGGAVRERAAGGDRLAGADLAGVDAGADDLQRGASRAGGRAAPGRRPAGGRGPCARAGARRRRA